jgi:4-hydroxy-tetrahydrodipicolinate synthase
MGRQFEGEFWSVPKFNRPNSSSIQRRILVPSSRQYQRNYRQLITNHFSGVVVAIVTPLRDGEIYLDGFRQLLDFLESRGVSGFFVCGTSGEGMILHPRLRRKAAEFATDLSKLPVIIHAGANNIEETIDLCKHAKDVGADGVGVITPMFYPYTSDGLVSYFTAAAASVDLPVFVYSNPSRANIRLQPETVSRLFSRGGKNLIGIKESSGDMSYFSEIIQDLPERLVFNGADNCFLPALTLGASGQVSGYANAIPELYVQLYKAWIDKQLENATRLQFRISRIRSHLTNPYITPIKEALRLRGVDTGEVQIPLVPMSKAEVERLGAQLATVEPEFFSKV